MMETTKQQDLVEDRAVSITMIESQEIAAALPFAALIERLSTALRNQVDAPLRVSTSSQANCELLVMPVMAERFAGVKILTVTATNSENGLPVIGGHFMLFDAKNGKTLAIIDAGELTARRTAAVSALASKKLSNPKASRLLVVGTGHLAPYLAEAHAAVRPITSVIIWGRSREKALQCCEQIQKRAPGIEVCVAKDLAAAASNVDIVSTATRSTTPLIEGAWLRPGTHVDLVGGYRPNMRELDDLGVRQSVIYVDTIQGALAEAGDIRAPIESGVISENAILGDIATLVAQPSAWNKNAHTLFKSVGNAMSDLAAAEMIWEKLGDC